MARTVFVPNHRFASQLLVTPQIRDLLESFWPELEDAAVSRARELSGDLRDGIHYDVDITPAGFAGRLNSDDWKSQWYEFGSIRTPADAFLRSAVEDVVGPVTGGDR